MTTAISVSRTCAMLGDWPDYRANKKGKKAPHLHFPQFLRDDKPKERRDGLMMATELLRRCNSLLICGDHITDGMMTEIQLAKQLGMVVTTLDGFLVAQRMRQRKKDA